MGKKRKAGGSYYTKSKKWKESGPALGKSMKGFFITCNMKEKQATGEAYSLLNEYADAMYGPEFEDGAKADLWAEKDSDDEEEDVDKAIAKEVSQIKERTKSKERRFQAVNSGANNIVFIKTSLPNPNELFNGIVTDLCAKKIPKSRYIMRMYPVAGTCKLQSYEKDIEEILRPFFADGEGHTFYLKIKIRNNDGAMRDGIFKTFCYVIKGLNMLNKPNYVEYEYIVIIDIIKTVLCISVLKDYKLYKEYNLQSLGDSFREGTQPEDGAVEKEKDAEEGITETTEQKSEETKETTQQKSEEGVKNVELQGNREKKESDDNTEVQGNGEKEGPVAENAPEKTQLNGQTSQQVEEKPEVKQETERTTETQDKEEREVEKPMMTQEEVKVEQKTDIEIKEEQKTNIEIKEEQKTDIEMKEEQKTDIEIKEEQKTDIEMKEEQKADVVTEVVEEKVGDGT